MKRFSTKCAVSFIALLVSVQVSAYDFRVGGLCYDILSQDDLTCAVVAGDEPYSGNIIIPERVTYGGQTMTVVAIGARAFYEDPVTSVVIGNSVTDIGYYAFRLCSSLEHVTFGNSVASIGYNAFEDCPNLTDFVFPSTLRSIGRLAFTGCTGLTKVTIPDSVTEMGSAEFHFCLNLKEAVVGNSVETMDETFGSCDNLERVVIGRSVNKIMPATFRYCESLRTIYLLNPVPPTVLESSQFTQQNYANATLYVPEGSLSAYQAADPWMNFYSIKEFETTDVSDVEAAGLSVSADGGNIIVENAHGRVSVYTVSGALVGSADADGGRVTIAVPGRGVYVVKAGGKAVKVSL